MKTLIIAGLSVFAIILMVAVITISAKNERMAQKAEKPIKIEINKNYEEWYISAEKRDTLLDLIDTYQSERAEYVARISHIEKIISALKGQKAGHQSVVDRLVDEGNHLGDMQDRARGVNLNSGVGGPVND